jgi:hypothetical protein
LEFIPNKGVGEIEFGQTPEEVHRVLGEPIRRIGETEQYASGWMIDYDEADRVDFLQTFPSHVRHEPLVTLNGLPLVGTTASDVVALINSLGVEPRDLDGDGRMYAHDLGLGFMGDPIESVWFYPPGYYDGLEQGE